MSGMNRWRRVARILPYIAVTFAAIYLVSAWSSGRLGWDVWLTSGGMIAFTIVGGLIEIRRQGQVIGRMCLVIGCALIVTGLLMLGAVTLDARPGRIPPLGAALAVLGSTSFVILLLAGGPLLVSRFPDGRARGRLTGLLDVLLVMSALLFLATVFKPGPITSGSIEAVDNPFGIVGIPFLDEGDSAVGLLVYLVTLVLAGTGLIRRYLRGDPVVRAQIRWFGASIALSAGLLTMMLATTIFEFPTVVGDLAWGTWFMSLILPPIAIGVSILRYRLYDIDRIVSNTLGYGLVTVVLFGLFAVINLALVSQVSPLVNNEGVAVAGSTLLVAALFNPLRTRVQRAIDRRFHRARFDADRTVSEFAARLRDQLDLSTLSADLASTSAHAVEPTTSGVWLRGHA
jgi:MFS family permease